MLLFLFACAAETVAVPDGDFTLDHATDGSGEPLGEAELGVVALTLDLAAGEGALTVTDGDDASTVTFALAPRDAADWHVGCPTNYGAARIETFDLDVDALAVGPLTLADPVLTATCGKGDLGDPVLAAWDGDAIAEPQVVFRAL